MRGQNFLKKYAALAPCDERSAKCALSAQSPYTPIRPFARFAPLRGMYVSFDRFGETSHSVGQFRGSVAPARRAKPSSVNSAGLHCGSPITSAGHRSGRHARTPGGRVPASQKPIRQVSGAPSRKPRAHPRGPMPKAPRAIPSSVKSMGLHWEAPPCPSGTVPNSTRASLVPLCSSPARYAPRAPSPEKFSGGRARRRWAAGHRPTGVGRVREQVAERARGGRPLVAQRSKVEDWGTPLKSFICFCTVH